MGKTLFAVSSGDYSDYRVIAIFDDRALAEKFKGRVRGANELEEYELNPATEALKKGWSAYRVEMWKDGDTIGIYEADFEDGMSSGVRVFRQWLKWSQKYGDRSYMQTDVYAPNTEHAVKVANERRAAFIASDEWDNDLKEMDERIAARNK